MSYYIVLYNNEYLSFSITKITNNRPIILSLSEFTSLYNIKYLSTLLLITVFTFQDVTTCISTIFDTQL